MAKRPKTIPRAKAAAVAAAPIVAPIDGSPANEANGAGETSAPVISSNTPPSEAVAGGAGDVAGSPWDRFDPEEFEAKYPQMWAARVKFGEDHGDRPYGPLWLRVTVKGESFRRAGIRHAGTVDHEFTSIFTPDQVEQLFAEPRLQVSFVVADAQ